MFRLYGEIAGRVMLDKSNNERDIIETIGEYISTGECERFLIILSTPEMDDIYRSIRSFEDYVNYVEDYNLRQKSIMQLKSEMFDLMEEPIKPRRSRR